MLSFTIQFHAPFLVSAGPSTAGYDDAIDEANPLPASSLKGVMKASARRLLPDGSIIREVFGGRAASAPWAWSDATLGDNAVAGGARIKLGDEGTVESGFLQLRQQVFATTARFEIEQVGVIDENQLPQHELVLRAAARAVLSLGSERRRGSGWVTITDAAQWLPEHTERLLSLAAWSA